MISKAECGSRKAAGEKKSAKLTRRAVFAIVLFPTAAASFNGFYTKVSFQKGNLDRGFEAILEGSASSPCVYRQLVPTIANLVNRITPNSFRNDLACIPGDDGRGIYTSLFSPPVAVNPTYPFRYLIFYLAAFAGSPPAASLFYLLCRKEGYTPEISLLSACTLILLIPYSQIRLNPEYSPLCV